jgi:hypothetical protein
MLFVVRGETTIDEKPYTVVNVPGSYMGAGFGVLITPDGNVHSQLLNDNIVISKTDLFFASLVYNILKERRTS